MTVAMPPQRPSTSSRVSSVFTKRPSIHRDSWILSFARPPTAAGVFRTATRFGAALLVVVSACSGDGPSSPVPANEVRVSNNDFSPATRTIAVGTTLTWRWVSGSSTHNVTFAGGPASPDQASGTFARLFSAAGTFAYQCSIHGASMSGTVTVQ